MTVGAALVGDQSGHVHAPEIVVRLVQLVNLIIVPPAILHENLQKTSAFGTGKRRMSHSPIKYHPLCSKYNLSDRAPQNIRTEDSHSVLFMALSPII